MNLDDDLHRALQRKPAPPDFEARVLDKVPRHADVKASMTLISARRRVLAGWLAAAAATAVLAIGLPRYYAHQQHIAEAENAKRDVMQALAIASAKLALVQQRVQDVQH
jgi:hypothetical protein